MTAYAITVTAEINLTIDVPKEGIDWMDLDEEIRSKLKTEGLEVTDTEIKIGHTDERLVGCEDGLIDGAYCVEV